MKICVNALLIKPGVTGGGETFLVNLVKRFARLDKNNHYLILTTRENQHLFDNLGTRIECQTILGSARSRVRRILFENIVLPFYLLYHKVDLYYSPFGTLPLFIFCKSAVTFQNLIYIDFKENVPYRGRTLRSKLVTNLQGIYYKLTTPLTLKQADMIWVVSQTTKAVLRNRYNIDDKKLEVIYEGVEFDRFNAQMRGKRTDSPYDFPYILTVATLYPNKNIDKIIDAYAQAVAKGIKHKLVIVGPDWLDYKSVLSKQVEKMGLKERVVFTGGVNHTQLPGYFRGADLFMLMSSVESFGLPVLEAMAAGVPVIISDRSSLPEIAGDAAISNPLDQQSLLADQIVRILTDEKLSNKLRERGRIRARKFNWEETAAKAIDLFNRVEKASR